MIPNAGSCSFHTGVNLPCLVTTQEYSYCPCCSPCAGVPVSSLPMLCRDLRSLRKRKHMFIFVSICIQPYMRGQKQSNAGGQHHSRSAGKEADKADQAGTPTSPLPRHPSGVDRPADSYCGSRLCNGGGEACFAAAVVPGT